LAARQAIVEIALHFPASQIEAPASPAITISVLGTQYSILTKRFPISSRSNYYSSSREELKLLKMKLVFIHGAPAVGKLTVARELSRLTGFPLFHNHLTVDLVGSLFAFGTPAFVSLREQIWLAAFAEAARSDLSLIFTFNPERTVNEEFIQKTIDIIEAAGGRVVFVELTCSEAELEKRMEQPSRKEFGKLASVDQYRSLKSEGAFEFPKLPNGISLDTTNKSPADSALLIHEYVASI